jgi:uncharacterized protein RhaS with RHS repeats
MPMNIERRDWFTVANASLVEAEFACNAAQTTHSFPKTRVRGSCRHASGRMSRRGRGRSMFTPGSRPCAYKTASGRHEWPNRDPFGEKGGINLYAYVGYNPLHVFDPYGEAPADVIVNTWGTLYMIWILNHKGVSPE